MSVVFWASDKPRERILGDAFVRGLAPSGDTGEIRALTGEPEIVPGTDVACMVGVKSRELYQLNWKAGVHTVYFDKGYVRDRAPGPIRTWEFWRAAVDGHHPTRYLETAKHSSDRWDALGIEVQPWRKSGGHIVIAGSSAKYHEFYGLPDPTTYAMKIVRRLRRWTDREIVYRPKPSWRDAVPIEGTRYSSRDETIDQVLTGAHAMITHGSNACFEALLKGVPTIVLGEGIAKPISSTNIEAIEKPRLATDKERGRLLSNLAYMEFTQQEVASGFAWSVLRPQIYG